MPMKMRPKESWKLKLNMIAELRLIGMPGTRGKEIGSARK